MTKLEVCPACGSCHENGDKRIVAEVTRNWTGKDGDAKSLLLSQRFEKVIKVNAERGYTLESWQMQTAFNTYDGPMMTETIIAVFVKDE